ncbi:unnamed protein product [Trifolium pratense]|uniref:Uncharacterized protein n=1 Tax=Trifolium pratense TaxID=57577 RepID=A0ACB0M941_TRIPR|nr:unnamed protein product [Trifolium pratense]
MATGVTSVDCHKQVRSWRLLRSLIRLLIPTCNSSTIVEDQDATISNKILQNTKYSSSLISSKSNTITGTIFGYRKGKINFCIQSNANSITPILLLELAVPTNILAREMSKGTLRIALESSSSSSNNGRSSSTVLSTPFWTMYCNGKKVGYAVKRRPSNTDFEVLNLMRSVVVGTGVMKCNGEDDNDDDDEVMYLRGSFKRFGGGSSECESFHLIDPEGDNIHQELSIFFLRSR